ncbi:hypothetical protein BKA67DRAFT_541039 [Truncatella angustata]|uniref:Uncharacterized protein n=1 Tax=Truncatella angustata TaxID=152316 RepID=A0A9P8RKN1_9PEZI|nr:uncharacterized protein BKA67DRAFT_541039 [Truncatella angustata]KAH6646048.1 hypothetical protein BKA67DRAFT_541039 [Truncatella angustata]
MISEKEMISVVVYLSHKKRTLDLAMRFLIGSAALANKGLIQKNKNQNTQVEQLSASNLFYQYLDQRDREKGLNSTLGNLERGFRRLQCKKELQEGDDSARALDIRRIHSEHGADSRNGFRPAHSERERGMKCMKFWRRLKQSGTASSRLLEGPGRRTNYSFSQVLASDSANAVYMLLLPHPHPKVHHGHDGTELNPDQGRKRNQIPRVGRCQQRNSLQRILTIPPVRFTSFFGKVG